MAPKLPTRKLGKNGPEVVAEGFGLMGLSIWYGSIQSDEERFKVLDRAYELGQTNWDTASIYGDNEELVGKWFKRTGKRDEIFLATKFAYKPTAENPFALDSSPEYCKESCARSLERLGVDCIDLFYVHRIDAVTPIEKTVQAMAELKAEGKIKYLGLSEVSAATLRRACAIHHIDALQIEYSPFSLEIEHPDIALLSTCRELGVAVIAYAPLGRGLMTGQIKSPDDLDADDMRKWLPRFSAENFPKNLKLVGQFEEVGKRKGCTSGQVALAWVLGQGVDIIPIPGTKKIKYLEENVAALDVKLTDEELKELRGYVDDAEVHGGRYPDSLMDGLIWDSVPL